MTSGMLDPLQKWISHSVKGSKQLSKYNAVSVSVPAYPDLALTNTSNEEGSHWNGKKMKEMSRNLLGVVTQSQQGGGPTQHAMVNSAIECTWAM
jgi:hypothetical protein